MTEKRGQHPLLGEARLSASLDLWPVLVTSLVYNSCLSSHFSKVRPRDGQWAVSRLNISRPIRGNREMQASTKRGLFIHSRHYRSE
ncbi:unnamed protein product [Sphagnum jensenii]|uniref:Uncharacterized protein n=1 Tax=Sphagnum jensenii TaxID=128206 RepID=A0ABP0VI48_9BRYO